jgi:hypothetical protein
VELVEFLLARVAEDEEVARSARPQDGDPEYPDYDRASWHEARCGYSMGEYMTDCGCGVPARVLAECDAKRRIVAWHRLIDGLDTEDDPVRGCGNCIASGMEPPYLIAGPCMTVRLLALPYAGHEDYDEAWRP